MGMVDMSKGKKIINVAVIGAGGRGRGVTCNLLKDSKGNVKVLSIFDPDNAAALQALDEWKSPSAKICKTYQEAIKTTGVDWVLIFSPNAYHKEHIIAAFDAGKHVFSEKPLATSVEDCQTINQAHKKSGLTFATGFVLRYAPLYQKAKQILDSGKIGKILCLSLIHI